MEPNELLAWGFSIAIAGWFIWSFVLEDIVDKFRDKNKEESK